MDWHKWHGLYDSRPVLRRRLLLVQNEITGFLDARPPGPVSVISVCAGDGRDLMGALQDHPRRGDVTARMVELDANLVATGETFRDALGLGAQVTFHKGDATEADMYRGVAPADLVLMCGMLGLVGEDQLANIVDTMRALCAPGGDLIWTRRLDWRNGGAQTRSLRARMRRAGFKPASYKATSWRLPFRSKTSRFAVGRDRFAGPALPLPQSGVLFTLSNAPIDR